MTTECTLSAKTTILSLNGSMNHIVLTLTLEVLQKSKNFVTHTKSTPTFETTRERETSLKEAKAIRDNLFTKYISEILENFAQHNVQSVNRKFPFSAIVAE